MSTKYLKVMFDDISSANNDLKYKINEVNIDNNFNPKASSPKDMGGFNFSTEDKIFRWLVRGDTLYDVIIPEDAVVINVPSETAPNGVFRTNKINLTNKRKITDEVAMYFYKKSKLPEKSYYKALAGIMVRGYKNTCLQLIRDKVNKDNIDLVLKEINDFVEPNMSKEDVNNHEVFYEVMDILKEIKSDLLICLNVDKSPYTKILSNDKFINLTGESGSGKSYYVRKYFNSSDYIVIDTDEVFSRYDKASGINKELGRWFRIKYDKLPDICEDFALIYKDILNYFNDSDKTIVIDSAQFRNLRTKEELSLLKGKIIIIRTCLDNCYYRCIERWKNKKNNNYSKEELENFKNKKLGIYRWYKSLNNFITNIDNYKISVK